MFTIKSLSFILAILNIMASSQNSPLARYTFMVKIISFLILMSAYGLSAQKGQTVMPAFDGLLEFQNIRDFTISHQGDECYFTIQSPLEEISFIAFMVKSNESWSSPELVAFTGEHKDLEPFLSPDNLRLYFASNRPSSFKKPSIIQDFDIWYVERSSVDKPWGDPINLGAPINTGLNEFYPSVAASGNMYFTTDGPNSKGKDDIYISTFENGKYTDPISLSDSINTEGYEFNAYISPDESVLLFTGYNRSGGYGSGDLYLSRRSPQGIWQKAINMGRSVNSSAMDYCPFVDFKTNTLYFTSRRSDYNNTLKINNIKEAKAQISKYQNGSSRLYKTSFVH